MVLSRAVNVFTRLRRMTIFFSGFSFIPKEDLTTSRLTIFVAVGFNRLQFNGMFFVEGKMPTLMFSGVSVTFFGRFFGGLLGYFSIMVVHHTGGLVVTSFGLFPGFLS